MRPAWFRVVRPIVLSLVILSCATESAVGPTLSVRNPSLVVLAPATLPAVRISEFHYDNTGTDTGEKVEISGPAGTSLAGWKIVLYNGSGGGTYEPTQSLTETIPATCGARGVIVRTYPSNGIQNGSPDGIALVDNLGKVVEFLSYEGAFVATNGPAVGVMSKDIGVIENGSEAVTLSLQRYNSGNWARPKTNSFLACNSEDETPTASVSISPLTRTLAPTETEQFIGSAFDGASKALAGVAFTWLTSDESIARVDVNGLVTAVAPGDVTVSAVAPNGMSATASLHITDPTAPPSNLPAIRFVEIHYDNTGLDMNEALEIEGPAGASVDGWSIALYNGSGGTVYDTRALSGAFTDMCGNGRGVIAARYEPDGIQNGPDGFALVDAAGKVVEFLSYEGSFTASNGPASGTASTDLGVSEVSVPVNFSIRRGTANDPAPWQAPAATISIGACNNGAGPPPPSYQNILFSGRTATGTPPDPPLPVGFQDQVFASVFNEVGAAVTTPITWSSDDAIASIDERGVFTALAAGTTALRATTAQGFTRKLELPTQIATLGTTAHYGNNTEFGEPFDADPSNDFILRTRPEYTLSYNRGRGTPNWVSYDLDGSHIGSFDRCDCFTFDPDLPADFPRYTTADYTGVAAINGFSIDRGHLARSFDRTTGSLDNATTFYFSNIVPQASDLNQQPWAALEDSLGNLARFHDKEVYIIAGVAGSRGTVKNEGKITIPEYTWKVAVVMPRDQGLANVHSYKDLEVFAVIMPNKTFKEGLINDWKAYKTTVDQVEALSGYNLLDKLDDQTEILVESGDSPPKAVWGGETSGIEGSGVDFDATGSTDPDAGDELSYSWDFGDHSTGSGARATHVFADNGVYNVVLTVTDKAGAIDATSNFVNVRNANPSVVLATAPTIVSGGTYSLFGGFGDPGQLDGPWSYTINWGDGSDSGTASGQGAITGTHAYNTAGSYAVTLTVRDKDGGTGSATATVRVVRIATGLGVNPAQINTRNNGNGQVIVTVFGSSSFTGDLIDVGSVRISGVRPDLRGNDDSKSSIEDRNGDGIADLVVHFDRSALVSGGALTAGTTELVLQANLTDGRQIEARGPVNVATRD